MVGSRLDVSDAGHGDRSTVKPALPFVQLQRGDGVVAVETEQRILDGKRRCVDDTAAKLRLGNVRERTAGGGGGPLDLFGGTGRANLDVGHRSPVSRGPT
jgi:hypothetical protein